MTIDGKPMPEGTPVATQSNQFHRALHQAMEADNRASGDGAAGELRAAGEAGSTPMATFELTFDDRFLLETFRRRRRTSRQGRALLLVKLVAGILCTGLIVVLYRGGAAAGALVLAVVLGFLVVSRRIDEWYMLRRFRRSPYRNEPVRIQLSPGGFDTASPKATQHLDWSAFTSARRFPDGVLLFQGPGLFNWLPLRYMVSGSESELDGLVREKIADVKAG